MKKLLIFFFIGLILISPAVFADSESNQKKPKRLEFKPTPFFRATFDFFCHKRDGFGFNLVGIDLALIKYRAFYFLNFGIGFAGFWEEKYKWFYYEYYRWELFPDGIYRRVLVVTNKEWAKYKDPYITKYFKFSPVKVPLNFTENMKNTVFFEVGIFSQNLKKIDGVEMGFSFSFNVFKNTKKEKEEGE